MPPDPIEVLFTRNPEARRRLMRAAVLAIRSLGHDLDDLRPYTISLRDGSLALLGRGIEIVRLPLDELRRRLDA